MADSPQAPPTKKATAHAFLQIRPGFWVLVALALTVAFTLFYSLRPSPKGPPPPDPYGIPSVGAEALYSLTLKRGDIMAAPPTDNAPLIARINSVQPVEDQSFLYVISYFGVEKGTYNLTDYLVTPDGRRLREPILPVQVISHVPESAEYAIQNPPLSPHRSPLPYTALLSLSAFAWGLAGLWMFLPKRKKRVPPPPVSPAVSRPIIGEARTLEDLLRPLVEKAASKTISTEEKSRMEQILFQYWGALLQLDHLNSVEQLRRILEHPEAGALLRTVEQWLYQPDSKIPPEEINAILKPYMDLPITEPHGPRKEEPA